MNSALPSLQAKASALAWTAAPLAALLTSPPTAYGQAPPQIQNIRERLNAWNSTAPVCDLSGRNL
ncbi:MAG: hypothetical protein OXC96_01955, partial [Cyanobacteria bacterium MAG CAR1_bin_15]|nr:hypothetical protein [Cyanobacteria bacterium MAG CAR1_bin_15]